MNDEMNQNAPHRMRFLAVAVMILFFTIPCVAQAEVAGTKCESGDIRIQGLTGAEHTFACDATARTVAFMKTAGFSHIPPIAIEIVTALPPGLPQSLGCYDSASSAVYLLTPEACEARWGAEDYFRIPNSDGIYWSFLVHEVAHAVASVNFSTKAPTSTALEYIAGVAQLSLMEADLRSQVLSQFPGKGYADAGEINILSYQLDPANFLVQSYRHYRKPEHGPAFVEKLLTGAVILPDYLIY